MSRLIDASTRTNNNNNNNKVQATTRMSREQVKEVLMNCRANPKHIEDCAVCPLFDVHVNCVSRMADEALEVIEEDEDKIRTLNEFALDTLKAQRPRVMTLEEVRTAEVVWLEQVGTCVCAIKIQNFDSGTMSFAYAYNNFSSVVNIRPEYYGKISRCWTSRPDEKVMAETPWDT